MSQSGSTTGSGASAYRPTGGDQSGRSATQDEAKEQAGQVASHAQDKGKEVAGTAKEQAADVKDEATAQAKDLYGEAKAQLNEHAGDQQQRAAGAVRSISSELGSMVDGSEGGPATDLVRQAGQRADEVASWLERGDPSSLLDDVRSFAARRPGTFLAMAAGAGLVAGRLTRGLKDSSSGSGSQGSASGTSRTTSSSRGDDVRRAGTTATSSMPGTERETASTDVTGAPGFGTGTAR